MLHILLESLLEDALKNCENSLSHARNLPNVELRTVGWANGTADGEQKLDAGWGWATGSGVVSMVCCLKVSILRRKECRP